MNSKRNNLDQAASPYLRQHQTNPIWWQEWKPEVLAHAKKENKPLLVSVGYATCHWCHVMAAEAFSDKETAAYLNNNFVAIKVDRERRPDIDRFCMGFITALTGHGGWPLNVFFSSDLRPIHAITYAPIKPRAGLPVFLEILKAVKEVNATKKDKLQEFKLGEEEPVKIEEDSLISSIAKGFDETNGGFGASAKFPPHSSLLFMLYYYGSIEDKRLKQMSEQTLDTMLLRGLHDHLQGGFFRYCTDPAWTIPHFEKMLYDQAMLLWAYSLGYKVLDKEAYKKTAEKLVQCLEDTFEDNGLFYSAHDADTDHKEGTTYVWALAELKKSLSKKEYEQFLKVYAVTEPGNFEGKNHLIKQEPVWLSKIENKLLEIRNKRPQPETDKKIVTVWNCLAGIALINAWRFIGYEPALKRAKQLLDALLSKHYQQGRLSHSSFGTAVQKEEFLEDYAGLLLFITYLQEETGDKQAWLKEFREKVLAFKKDGRWLQSHNRDFMEVPAESADLPLPSGVSLAELALVRTAILLKEDYSTADLAQPLAHDFLNIAALVKNGLFQVIESPQKIDWAKLPANAIQLRGPKLKSCYKGTCQEKEKRSTCS